MLLNLSVKTDKPDIYVDYIEVIINTGEKISINWDMSYIERTDNGFDAQLLDVNYYDEPLNESIYLTSEDIKGIEIKGFGIYTDIGGPIYFKVDEMTFEDEGMEYILDPSLYSNANNYIEQNSSIYFIDGKSYRIDKYFDAGIERENSSGEKEICKGYYCQLYHTSDTEYSNEIDNFCLAAGYELKDLSEESFEIGVKNYLDNKSIWICVYKDTLNYHDDNDNLTYIQVPRLWLYHAMKEEGITDNNLWFNEYTADNTENIARKALEEGIIIECADKNINIHLKKGSSLDDKLRSAAQKHSEAYKNNIIEKGNLEL